MSWSLRVATEKDIEALENLIELSVQEVLGSYYSSEQLEASLGPVFGVDRQLIRDGTYFVVDTGRQTVGCGGWSMREALFGGDRERQETDRLLDPSRDPARIRAFFVHPLWLRHGIGKRLLSACEDALKTAGFRRAELVATLAGEPLYARFGYQVIERYETPMTDDLSLEVVKMAKSF